MKKNSLHYRCIQDAAELLDGQRLRYIDNGSNVLAVAHTDFVLGRGDVLRYRRKGDRVRCISLDDRLGVHIILDVLPKLGIKPDVLLTTDEEIGASTAGLFDPPKEYNWIFSFDRRGAGAVTYDYGCMDSIAKYYFRRLYYGAFSDISSLEHLQCGGINIGTGYYDEHSMRCNADLAVMRRQVKRFAEMFEALKDTWIEHWTDAADLEMDDLGADDMPAGATSPDDEYLRDDFTDLYNEDPAAMRWVLENLRETAHS